MSPLGKMRGVQGTGVMTRTWSPGPADRAALHSSALLLAGASWLWSIDPSEASLGQLPSKHASAFLLQ